MELEITLSEADKQDIVDRLFKRLAPIMKKEPKPEEELLRTDEAMEYLGIKSETGFLSHRKRHDLTEVVRGKCKYYKKSELLKQTA